MCPFTCFIVPAALAVTLLMDQMIEGGRGNEARVANKARAWRFAAGLAAEQQLGHLSMNSRLHRQFTVARYTLPRSLLQRRAEQKVGR